MVHIPMHPAIPQPHVSMDHMYNSLPFLIQNSNSSSFMSQTFMLQGSHMDPTPAMSWGGYPVGQSCSAPLPCSGQGYWPLPPWAPLATGQAPVWGMPPWMTPTPQRPFHHQQSVICAYTFNCSIRYMSKCLIPRLLVHLCIQTSFFIGWTWIHRRGPKHERIRWGRGWWLWQWRGAMIELYVMYLCHKTRMMYYCVKTIWIVDLCLVVWMLYVLLYNLLLYALSWRFLIRGA
jgi:hypothetical protein